MRNIKERSKRFRGLLLRWYRTHARDLPWRRTRDPYRIVVSEFMLQQTQVSRVELFYPAFLERFPTIRHLARAQPKAVREAWEGLGYYARARNLHALARQVVGRYDGRLPDEPEALIELPGVGRYTAGAVACFAYEKPTATVDTNVARVVRRVFIGERQVRSAERGVSSSNGRSKRIWEIAEVIVPRNGKTAWRLNQGIMELGALLCVARAPKCPICPVRAVCKSVKHFSR